MPAAGTGTVCVGETVPEEFRAGQLVPESGMYRVTHDPEHGETPPVVTFIRGRRFPTCPHCDRSSFVLVYSDEAYWRNRSGRKPTYRQRRRLRQGRPRRIAASVVAILAALGRLIRKRKSHAVGAGSCS